MFRVLIGCVAVLLAAAPSITAAGANQLRSSPTTIPVVAAKPHVGPLPALPRVSYQPAGPMAVIQQVYEFAARHPEVLQYMPCYCGCERIGHRGNHDCFVKSRAANGTITQWDEHGIGCAVCLGVGRDAMTLFNGGAKPAQIRAAIDKKYGSLYPSSTPTPAPR
jgi:hypothetical protein